MREVLEAALRAEAAGVFRTPPERSDMEDHIIKTFQDGAVQAVIVSKTRKDKTFYRMKLRREYLDSHSGEMRFSIDYDDYHIDSLRKVARLGQQWLQERKANSELTGRNAA